MEISSRQEKPKLELQHKIILKIKNKMKYLDLFAGYGGFSLGIKQAYDNKYSERFQQGINNDDMSNFRKPQLGTEPFCIGFSEIDKYATKTYKKHFNHKEYGDITKINAKELEDFDLLCGGFPCQAFSIAGKRAGFEDTRGTLIYDVFRIINEKHPRVVLLENVKGLLSHDGGRTFKTIITSLAELGYAVEWQVLNAKNFGVPQNRERVFIVGHLGGFGGRQVFPIQEHSDEIAEIPGQHSNTLTTRYYGGQANGSYIIESELNAQRIIQLNKPIHSNDRVYAPDGISPTLNTMQGGNRQPFVALGGNGIDKSQEIDAIGVRKANGASRSVDEMSDSQRYKLCGNGVVVNVVQKIITKLLDNSSI